MRNTASMLDEVVAREQIFWIIVPYTFQRTILSVFRFYAVHNRHRNLDICIVNVIPRQDKIAFQLAYPPYTDIISFGPGINIDDIFQSRTIVNE